MPRPMRCRRVCSEPVYNCFVPKGDFCGESVILSVDEYEIIRLIDLKGLTHEQCAARMDISRTTATEVYESARRKLADCLVNGKELHIGGGCYKLCDGSAVCFCGMCKKFSKINSSRSIKKKGVNEMRIAVTYDNGEIFQHFGHTEEFKIFDVESGKIADSRVISADGFGHGALADFLKGLDAEILICGGIGGGAISALSSAGIKVCGRVSGSADEAVEKLLSDSLAYSAEANCSHHHEGHGHNHSCGDHGCHGKGGGCRE